jgi:phage terminase small subunit
MAFTKKQRGFIEHYLVDPNGTRAARAAGYAAKSAAKAADRLLKHERVNAEIARRRSGGEAPMQVIATDPLSYLLGVMRNTDATDGARMRAAIAAARYIHAKPGTGKKETQIRAAAAVAGSSGRFKTPGGPTLSIVKPE